MLILRYAKIYTRTEALLKIRGYSLSLSWLRLSQSCLSRLMLAQRPDPLLCIDLGLFALDPAYYLGVFR